MALTDKLKAIADSIRAKTGTTDPMSLDQMPNKISSIESGGGSATEPYVEETFQLIDPSMDADYHALISVNRVGYTFVPRSAYENCDHLTSVYINGATSIEKNAFCNCTSLTTINLPESITNIGENVFRECTKLALTSLPESLTFIESYAFYNCSSLALTELPSSLTSIGERTFYQCSNLAITSLPESLTHIGASAFYGCTNLTLTSLPEGIKTVGSYAFCDCSSLRSMSIPASVTTIYDGAFGYCTNLTQFILHSETVCKLYATNTFASTPIASGTGYIYVPSTLVESYKAAAYWSTYANQIRALEDYTVDGTVTGELDEGKI